MLGQHGPASFFLDVKVGGIREGTTLFRVDTTICMTAKGRWCCDGDGGR